MSSGSPLAVTVRVTSEPASAVTSPNELVMYAEAMKKKKICFQKSYIQNNFERGNQ